MNKEYTAVIKKENDWWIGWIEEVPGVNCQERTREELLETLRITLKEALDFNRQDALSAAGSNFQEEKITVLSERNCFLGSGKRGLNHGKPASDHQTLSKPQALRQP